MATYYAEPASASWQGNFFPRGASNGEATWETVEISATAAQAVANNLFRLIKLDADTIVLDGYCTVTGLDGHATPTATVDVGFESDSDGDGDTDVVDFFVDGMSVDTTVNFDANDLGATGPFYPVDTLTSDGSRATGYFVTAKLLGAVATAAAGTIRIGLLIAPKNGHSSAAE